MKCWRYQCQFKITEPNKCVTDEAEKSGSGLHAAGNLLKILIPLYDLEKLCLAENKTYIQADNVIIHFNSYA